MSIDFFATDEMEEVISDELCKNNGNLSSLKFDFENPTSSNIYNYIQTHASNSRFNTTKDILQGLTICVNDTWGNKISIKDY